MKKIKKIKTAKTPMDYSAGLLKGVNTFNFGHGGNHPMTMNPHGISLTIPIYYQGLSKKGKIVDEGIAMPGEEFNVKGNEVREIPLYRQGGYIPKYQYSGDLEDPYQMQDPSMNSPFSGPFLPEKAMYEGIEAGPPSYLKSAAPASSYLPTKNSISGASVPYNPLSNTPSRGLPLQYDNKDFFNMQKPYKGSMQHDWDILTESLGGAAQKVGQGFKDFAKFDPYEVNLTDLPLNTMYNLYRGIFEKADKTPLINNRYDSAYLSGLQHLKYRPDYTKELLMNTGLQNKIRGSVSSIPGMMNNMIQAQSNLNEMISAKEKDAANTNIGLTTNYLNAMKGVGDKRAANLLDNIRENQAHKASKKLFLAQGIKGADDFLDNFRKFKQQELSNKYTEAALNMQSSNYKVYIDPKTHDIQYYSIDPEGNPHPIDFSNLKNKSNAAKFVPNIPKFGENIPNADLLEDYRKTKSGGIGLGY